MRKTNDSEFMKRALELAESVAGRTSPDPMVGAVIVKNGRIVGAGYHAEVGTPHAESFALKKAGSRAKGATMYVNLEPCCHYGNNPPCVNQIIRAGVKKVVAAMKDPNPLVFGKGFKMLKNAGVEVKVGILGSEAARLNEAFIKYISTKTPFVILKSAMSIDGKIATSSGESRWISGPESRRLVHKLRNRVDAVMVGIGTIMVDNPALTTRMVTGRRRNALKIIIDKNASIPLRSKVLVHEPEKTIIVTSAEAPKTKLKKIKTLGAKVMKVRIRKGCLDLRQLMKDLAEEGIVSVMIEGGSGISAVALETGIVDKVMFFLAPCIIGGSEAPTAVGGDGIKKLSRALRLKNVELTEVGGDFLIEGDIKK